MTAGLETYLANGDISYKGDSIYPRATFEKNIEEDPNPATWNKTFNVPGIYNKYINDRAMIIQYRFATMYVIAPQANDNITVQASSDLYIRILEW